VRATVAPPLLLSAVLHFLVADLPIHVDAVLLPDAVIRLLAAVLHLHVNLLLLVAAAAVAVLLCHCLIWQLLASPPSLNWWWLGGLYGLRDCWLAWYLAGEAGETEWWWVAV
jgi:hypothetical protein